MVTGHERVKVREATLTFQVLVLLRLLMRRCTNNQYAELRTDFFLSNRSNYRKSLIRFAFHQLLIETVQFLWPCVSTKRGDSVYLAWLVFVEGVAPAYH